MQVSKFADVRRLKRRFSFRVPGRKKQISIPVETISDSFSSKLQNRTFSSDESLTSENEITPTLEIRAERCLRVPYENALWLLYIAITIWFVVDRFVGSGDSVLGRKGKKNELGPQKVYANKNRKKTSLARGALCIGIHAARVDDVFFPSLSASAFGGNTPLGGSGRPDFMNLPTLNDNRFHVHIIFDF